MKLIYFPNSSFGPAERTLICGIDFDFAIYPITGGIIAEPLPDGNRIPANEDSSIGLYMAGIGTGVSQIFGGPTLYMEVGNFYQPSGVISLYMSGGTSPTGTSYLNLYISSENPVANNFASLFMQVNGGDTNRYIPLYLKSKFTDSSIPLDGGYGVLGVMNLFLLGTSADTGVAPPPLETNGYTTGIVNLYINGDEMRSSGSIPLYIGAASLTNNNINLFVNGVTMAQNIGTISLHTSGMGYITNGSGNTKTLFIRGI